MAHSKENLITINLNEALKPRKLRKGEKSAAELAAMSDKTIDYSDIPELSDEFWQAAAALQAASKVKTSMRMDEDVLNWFRAQGKGYQTKMNNVLRAWMVAHQDNKKAGKRI